MRFTPSDLLVAAGLLAIALYLYPLAVVFILPSLPFAAFFSFRAAREESVTIEDVAGVGAKSAFIAVLVYGGPYVCYYQWSTLQWNPIRLSDDLPHLCFAILATAFLLLVFVVSYGLLAAMGGALTGAGVGVFRTLRTSRSTQQDLVGEPVDQPNSQ